MKGRERQPSLKEFGLFKLHASPRHFGAAEWLMPAALCLSLILLSGCVTRGGDIPYAPTGFPGASFETRGQLEQDVPLGPLDVVEITVFRVPELSGTYQVSATGMLDMPLIGSVDTRGRSASELSAELETAYGSNFLRNPQISVRVPDGGQLNITVEGGVREPGVYPLRGSVTLLTALALAKGVDVESGNPRRVAIFRKSGPQTLAAAFDVVDIRRGKMENPTVYPGDIVVVDGAGTRPIYREILQAIPALAIFNAL